MRIKESQAGRLALWVFELCPMFEIVAQLMASFLEAHEVYPGHVPFQLYLDKFAQARLVAYCN